MFFFVFSPWTGPSCRDSVLAQLMPQQNLHKQTNLCRICGSCQYVNRDMTSHLFCLHCFQLVLTTGLVYACTDADNSKRQVYVLQLIQDRSGKLSAQLHVNNNHITSSPILVSLCGSYQVYRLSWHYTVMVTTKMNVVSVITLEFNSLISSLRLIRSYKNTIFLMH